MSHHNGVCVNTGELQHIQESTQGAGELVATPESLHRQESILTRESTQGCCWSIVVAHLFCSNCHGDSSRRLEHQCAFGARLREANLCVLVSACFIVRLGDRNAVSFSQVPRIVVVDGKRSDKHVANVGTRSLFGAVCSSFYLYR